MSTELDRIKKLVNDGLLTEAVEIPSHHQDRALVVDDVEEVLSRFDADVDYAHFIIRVKRSHRPLPKPSSEPQPPQLSIDSMVNETLELLDRTATDEVENREVTP